MDSKEMSLKSGIVAFEAKNFTMAMKLLSPLSDAGDAEAQYRMAIMYQNGLGVVADELLAFKCMVSAAKQDLRLAQHGLAFMYLEGECIGKDAIKAVEWFTRSAEQGLAGSQSTLAMIYEEGRGLPVDREKAKQWYRRAGFTDKANTI